MDASQIKFVYTGAFFVGMILSGFWVSRSGKPYNTLIFTTHKFIGLGLGFFLIKTVYNRQQLFTLEPSQISTLAFTVILFILTVIAGGLLSIQAEGGLQQIGESVWVGITRVHKFFPYLIVLSTAFTLYQLFS